MGSLKILLQTCTGCDSATKYEGASPRYRGELKLRTTVDFLTATFYMLKPPAGSICYFLIQIWFTFFYEHIAKIGFILWSSGSRGSRREVQNLLVCVRFIKGQTQEVPNVWVHPHQYELAVIKGFCLNSSLTWSTPEVSKPPLSVQNQSSLV